MKRTICLLVAVVLMLCLCSCDDTFKMSKITSITVAGPGTSIGTGSGTGTEASSEGISVELTSANGSDYTEILRICQGEIKTDIDDSTLFGFAKIIFTDTAGNQTTVYPACDGSPCIKLYSLRLDDTSYITISDTDMEILSSILFKFGVDLDAA